MQIALQVLVNFILTGSLYALTAIGLSLIFGVMRIINFAHAQMYMLGAYGIVVLYGDLGWPYVLALVASAVTVALLGVLCELLVIRPVRRDPERAMISTLGLLLIIGGVVFIVFGGLPRFVDPPIQGTVRGFRGVVNVDVAKLVDGAAAIVLIAALFVWLRVAKSGQALRAVAQNELGAQLQGIRTGRIRTGGFALGVGLAAIAGGLIMSITSATPDMGNQILLNLFIMVILGGLDSVAGAVVGAFILAFMETVGVTYFGQFSILSVYGVVMLILIVRPEGILGHR